VARDRLSDVMQQYPFWLFDAGVMGGNILFPVLDPSLGFSSISSPEISVELKDIQPGNWEYKRRVVKAADTSPITLSRGARFYDSDFYNWITRAITGQDPSRRTLFLLHFLTLRGGGGVAQIAAGAALGAVGGIAAGGGVAGAAGGAAGGAIIGSFIDDRIPGRCWTLYDCVPTRYKSGNDFDATSGAVSIAELEVQPEYVQEITVSTLAPGISGAVGAIGGAVNVVGAF
jgi:phage tail-like protein